MTGITNPTEEYFKDGLWGWDGTQWRKLNLLFGYYDRWQETVTATSTGGDTAVITTPVPTGYVYICNTVVVQHTDSTARRLRIQAFTGAAAVEMLDEADVPAYTYKFITYTYVVLRAGDSMRAIASSLADGKLVELKVWGYKMKVT